MALLLFSVFSQGGHTVSWELSAVVVHSNGGGSGGDERMALTVMVGTCASCAPSPAWGNMR